LLVALLFPAWGDAAGESGQAAAGSGGADAGSDAGSGGAAAGAGGSPGGGGAGVAGTGGAAGGSGQAGDAAPDATSDATSGYLEPCYSADQSCPPDSYCIEACYYTPNGGPGGVCAVPGRDGCGCGVVFDACEDPGLQCLMPSCCDWQGVCVTPEERAKVCAGAAAPRFDCAGTQQMTSRLACNLFTGVERYAIWEKDEILNLCFEIVVALGGGSTTGIAVNDGWAVESASVSNAAADCRPYWAGAPVGEQVAAQSGAGTLTMATPDAGFLVPFVSADVTLGFPQSASWVPPTRTIQFAQLPTQTSGCDVPDAG
jgi:hypothetical protein